MVKKSVSVFDQICTADEAAALLNLTPERVMQFCRAGRLEARKLGRDWAITLASVREFAEIPRPNGPIPQPENTSENSRK